MNSFEYEMINDVLIDLRQEYDDLRKQINEYVIKIEETDCYIQSFLDKEDNDFKIFSPRNMEDIHKDQIEKSKNEKSDLQEKLNLCYHKQNILRSRIDKIEKIVSGYSEYHIDSEVRIQNLIMLNIQEEDRKRIARDLHDTSLQNLAHLVHKVELSTMFIDQDPLRAKLELSVVSKNLKSVIEEIRNTIFDLRPMSFDDLGLVPAFERLVEVINEDNLFEIDMDTETASCDNDLILAEIYRIVQECLINIKKHAGAGKILFHCKNNNGFYYIDIEDNGIGFTESEFQEKQDRHFGITVVKERVALLGGKIHIESKKGKGTRIHIEIPLV